MAELVDASIEAMGPQYPDLVSGAERVRAVAVAEEGVVPRDHRQGRRDLRPGGAAGPARPGECCRARRPSSCTTPTASPIDLTLEMAAEQGLQVDEAGFRALMPSSAPAPRPTRRQEDRRARRVGLPRAARRGRLDRLHRLPRGALRGDPCAGLLVDGAVAPVGVRGRRGRGRARPHPFYAEAGGQLADAGRLVLSDGTVLEVTDVQKALPDLVVHRARVVSGEATVGAGVLAEVDVERRRSVSRAHTATHLVHKAIRAALGEQASQAGSLNAPGRFRFDFSSPGAVPESVLHDVEQEINEIALADLEVRAFVTSQEEARRIGAMALFGEKYGDEVRVVEVGDYARELCGGTHAARSGQLGMVKLLSESSIGAGVRRVEGLVGLDAYSYLAREHVLMAQLASSLKVPSEQVPDRVAATLERLREVEKELAQLRAQDVLKGASGYADAARDVFGVAYVGIEAPAGIPGDLLRSLALDIRGRIPAERAAAVIVAAGGDRASLVAAVNDAGRARGLSASALLREAAVAVEGKGGGKDDVAQGGGAKVEGIADALVRAEHMVGRVATGGA
jgi:alanyl-tRNA synthetase